MVRSLAEIIIILKDQNFNNFDKDKVIKFIPQDFGQIRKIVEDRLQQGHLSIIEEMIIDLCYQMAVKCCKREKLDLIDDGSLFIRKVKIYLDRAEDLGPLVYDDYLPPDLVWKLIQGYTSVVDEEGRGKWVLDERSQISKAFALKILNPNKGDHILDLGCGYGTFTYRSALSGAKCVGIDYSAVRIESARQFIATIDLPGKIELMKGDAEDLNFPRAHFNKVICADLYEHLSKASQRKTLREIYRVLKPDGYAVIKTPNLNYLIISTWYKRLRAIIKFRNPWHIKIPFTTLGYKEDCQHIGLTKISRLIKELKMVGFKQTRIFYCEGTKFNKYFPNLNRIITTKIYYLRDLVVEEIIVKATK